MGPDKSTLFTHKLPVRHKRVFIIICAFTLPVAILLMAYFLMGIYPFGERTLLLFDLNGQYISFFSYLKHMFLEGLSPFYTFSKTLGGDMIGLGAYYLLSPLNLIFLLFELEDFTIAIFILTILKIGLCGLTMCIYLNRKHLHSDSIIFSSAYALMAYNMVNQSNIMWLDGVILLPIVILGIEVILEDKSPLSYILSLSATIVINYYIGFMICIFSVLYFLCRYFFFRNGFSKKKVIHFGISSLLTGGLSAFILLPVLYSLQGGKATFSLSTLSFRTNFIFHNLLSKFLIGSYSFEEMMYGLPNIYCGIFISFFCIVFFVHKGIKRKEKIGFGLLLLIIVLSFYINTLNLIWHGFNHPSWFLYRYSFVFSFLLIMIAYRGYCESKQVLSVKSIAWIFTAMLAIFIFVGRTQYQYLDNRKILISIGLLILTVLVFVLYFKSNKKIVFMIAIGICCIDLGISTFWLLNWQPYIDYNRYTDYVRANEAITSQIKESDSSFYRLERTYLYNLNDSMMFQTNGLTHYSSSEKSFIHSFIEKMGLRHQYVWALYNQGSTISVDSLLGVKYLLTRGGTLKPYELMENNVEGYFIYKNPYALPLGFMVNDDVVNVFMEEENLFELQNKLWDSMTEQPQSRLFTPIEIKDVKVINLTKEEYGGGARYIKKDKNEDSFIEFYFEAASNDPMYAYFTAELFSQVDVFINEYALGQYFGEYHYGILNLGSYEDGEQLVFRMKLLSDDVYISEAFFYYQDMSVFMEYYSELSELSFHINSFRNSNIEGNITNNGNKKYALFTIPFEKNWKVYINGNIVHGTKVFDALLAVEIPEGTYSVTLKYIPKGLYIGWGITAVSFVGVLIWVGWIRKFAHF